MAYDNPYQQLQTLPQQYTPYNYMGQRGLETANPNVQHLYRQSPVMNSPAYLKGRPVVSIEEARAAQIDLDGSLFIFTDIGNKKIYTKQINLDGTATLNVYTLSETEGTANPKPQENNSGNYATKEELQREIDNLKALIASMGKVINDNQIQQQNVPIQPVASENNFNFH